METAYIIAIVVVVALVFLFFRFRSGGIGLFKGSVRARRGNAEIEGSAEIRGAQEATQNSRTSVRGNVMRGENQKMRVTQENAVVEDN